MKVWPGYTIKISVCEIRDYIVLWALSHLVNNVAMTQSTAKLFSREPRHAHRLRPCVHR